MSESEEALRERRRLEWELSLSFADIRSNPWFHGSITRAQAEQLLTEEGHFLVRDCTSRSGHYVLSCVSGGQHLHFIITRVERASDGSAAVSSSYTFEDDHFDTIADLITCYVGNRRCVSAASMAVITTPVTRKHCLTDFHLSFEQNFDSFLAMTENNSFPPPPKPSRVPTMPVEDNCDNEEDNDGSQHSWQRNGSEDSAFFSQSVSPKHSIRSQIRAHSFHTYLLPKDNKPLEPTAIVKIQSVLLDTGPRILANHLTKCDVHFIRLLDTEYDFGGGIDSALELILLPNGRQMRLDLLERFKCFKYFIVLTILTTNDDKNRANILNKWIEIAIETKTALGNLFGFAAIMEALTTHPILQLETSWCLVRKELTQNAITFETKLKPQMKAMTECNEPQAPNTSFPFIVTLIEILENHSKICDKEFIDYKCESLNLWFEQTSVDCGLQHIHSHLELAPQMIAQLPTYRRNAHIVLDDILFEELLCDMFATEFHRQFLFGFRASDVHSDEKFDKLDRIVSALLH